MFEFILLTFIAICVSIILLMGFAVVTLVHSVWSHRRVFFGAFRKFRRRRG